MFHFFDMSFGETGPRRDCCHDIAWCRVAIVMFREASLRQVGSSELKVTRLVLIVAHDRSQAHAVGPPTPRLDEHHGIVMDWARWGLE
jgi:hypothetical protein